MWGDQTLPWAIKFSRTPASRSEELWGMEMALDWSRWQEKRSPASPCPSCWERGDALGLENHLGDKKKKKRRREEVETPPGWCVLPLPGSSPLLKSASGAFILLIFAAIQSLLSIILHVKVARLLSRDGSVTCPQGSPCPQGRERAGTAGLNARIWAEPAQPG